MDTDDRRRIREECRDLVVSLVHYQDHGDAEAAAALMTKDGVWLRAGKPLTGRAEMLAYVRDRKATLVVRHLTTNIKIEVTDENNAVGVTYYVAYHFSADSNPPKLPVPLDHPFSIGEWHDTFVRTPEGWLLFKRETKRIFQYSGVH